MAVEVCLIPRRPAFERLRPAHLNRPTFSREIQPYLENASFISYFYPAMSWAGAWDMPLPSTALFHQQCDRWTIISQAFHQTFVEGLIGFLRGRSKEARAALIASYVLGITLLCITEPKATFKGRGGQFIRRRLREALDDCFLPVAE